MPLISRRGAAAAQAFGFTSGVSSLLVNYFIVAGGGASGANSTADDGGGGGAGGLLQGQLEIPAGLSTTITVGAGGAVGASGGNTAITPPAPASPIVAIGGGRGGNASGGAGQSGGSGGGGARPFGAAGAGTPGQGFAARAAIGSGHPSGGGGAGGSPTGSPLSYGGPGITSAFNGVTLSYGQGGTVQYFPPPILGPGQGGPTTITSPTPFVGAPGFAGIAYIKYPPPQRAIGGALGVDAPGGNIVHIFTNTTAAEALVLGSTPTTPYAVQFLVVGGGGTGGSGEPTASGGTGGGGGAGGFLTGTVNISEGSHSVYVGLGNVGLVDTGRPGYDGQASVFSTYFAVGGGGGGGGGYDSQSVAPTDGRPGGSGGGGGRNDSGVFGFGGAATAGQGSPGVAGATTRAGGGGGAGGTGTTTTGGIGLSSSITGTAVTYAAGGNAATGSSSAASNTGNGGPGALAQGDPGRGGSGIVVVRYPLATFGSKVVTGGTVTLVGSDYVHTFTTPGQSVFSILPVLPGVATFIGGRGDGGSAPTILRFAGAVQPGDLVIVTAGQSPAAITGGDGGWRTIYAAWYHNNLTIFSKLVTANDIAAAAAGTLLIPSTNQHTMVIYRGPTASALRSTVSTGPTGALTMTLPGFVKQATCENVIAFCMERDQPVMTLPTGFTQRLRDQNSAFKILIGDIPPASYVNSATMQFTALASANGEVGFSYELFDPPAGDSAWQFNPLDKNANITLSNNNKTIASTSGGNGSCRSTFGMTGKVYTEVQYLLASTIQKRFGICTAAALMGSAINTCMLSDGTLMVEGVTGANLGAFGAGSILGWAMDVTAKKFWVARNGVWLNGDPVAATGGATFTNAGSQYWAASTLTTADTFMTIPATYFYTPPAGFTPT